jgi:outer membrane immunogenic protein
VTQLQQTLLRKHCSEIQQHNELWGRVPVKRLFLAGFAVSAMIAPAIAADMPVPAAPIVTWTGYYVGANAGYALSTNSSVNSVGIPNQCTATADVGCTGSIFNPANIFSQASAQAATFTTPSGRSGGFIGGGQFGYNYQFGANSVMGLEADLQAMTGSSHSSTLVSVTPVPGFPGFPINQTATVSTKLDYVGTIRARAGYLWTPNFLLYFTAGLAYGQAEINSSITQNVVEPPAITPYSGAGTDSNVRFGGAIGGGLEWLIAQNWSVKAEYLYVGLGTANVNLSLVNVDHVNGGSLSTTAVATSARFNENIVRGGLNYHF